MKQKTSYEQMNADIAKGLKWIFTISVLIGIALGTGEVLLTIGGFLVLKGTYHALKHYYEKNNL